MAEMSDRAIMTRVREGCEASLGMLLQRHWSGLTAYASRLVHDREDAKDVVQEVFARVWLKRTDWEPCGSVSGYLYRITRNLSLNWRRSERVRSRAESRGGLQLLESGKVSDPLEQLEAHRLRREVEAAIEQLPDRRREVFVLSRFHGLTHREIGEALGISVPTVSNQMSAALAQLALLLSHHLNVDQQ